MNQPDAILWRGLYLVGHEYARIERRDSDWHLEGVAVFSHDAVPCRLDYHVRCTGAWVTRSARVSGWIAARPVRVALAASEDRRWWLNDVECPAVEGSTDLDLNFSPSTNTLPIRRLSLEVGAQRTVRAAWLRFPSLELEPLEQTYGRLAEDRYRYESGGGRFTAELRVDRSGFVREYPGIWVAE
ncbi:MAG: putative glycolipid-binding domain-containing protein [Candidatus Rokubacteria bacterium]|nr:putative glycolipid-binding domain-containing protein [Candidatus Rokubacteria bacterium]